MRERSIKSIDEILEISFNFLKEHGLENTSIRDLSKETGMSLGSIYYWFDSKEDLVVNAVKYGLAKSSMSIFAQAVEIINDLDNFTVKLMDIVKTEQRPLQMVFQAAASPLYGDIIRNNAKPLNLSYEDYIIRLSEISGVSYEELRPLVYMFLATVLDYVIWDDYEFSKSQLDYIFGILKDKMPK